MLKEGEELVKRTGDEAFLESCRVIGGLWRSWKEGDGAWEEHRHENPTCEDAEEQLDTLRGGTKLSAIILIIVCSPWAFQILVNKFRHNMHGGTFNRRWKIADTIQLQTLAMLHHNSNTYANCCQLTQSILFLDYISKKSIVNSSLLLHEMQCQVNYGLKLQ